MRLLLLFFVFLAACSGGGGEGESVSQSAFAVVAFPPEGGLTDADEVTVRGTTPGAASVRVDGVAATSSDGFLTWRARVPLRRGVNRLEIASELPDGSERTNTLSVRREEILLGSPDVALDAGNGRLLLVQSYFEAKKALIGIDLTTGRNSVVSGPSTGAGPALSETYAIAVDAAGNRALLYDDGVGAVLAVDLTSGDRTVVSGGRVGAGTDLEFVRGLVYDASRDRIIAIAGSRLIRIDATSGDRNHFTDDLNSPFRIALDATNDRAVVLASDGIWAVDLETASHSVISDESTGAGPALASPQDLDCNAAGTIALVTQFRGGVLEVDLATGDRRVVSDDATGSGLDFSGERGIVLDATRNRALVNDWNDGRDAVLAVDLTTGDRSLLFESARGSGPFFDDPRDVTLDSSRNRALVSDGGSDGRHILAVDLRTADRTVLAPYSTGRPEGIVVEEARDRILLTDGEDALYAMDPVTGARTVLSDATTGTGPLFDGPEDLVVDAANDRALVVDDVLSAVIAVDLATGDRTILSDASTGTGPAIERPQDIELDSANDRALVLESENQRLLAIDLATGNRTILCGDGVGSGPELFANEGFWFDAANNRALVAERRQLLSIDLDTGNRTIISDPETGAGPVLGFTLEDVVVLPGNVALILDDSSPNFLFAVDLETGDRFVFSK